MNHYFKHISSVLKISLPPPIQAVQYVLVIKGAQFIILVPVSCTHAKSLGYHDSKFYVIDPDGPHGDAQPFIVYCNMSSHNGIGVTVISHDSEARTRVYGCEANGCYRRDIVYEGVSNVNQLRALTAISAGCEQFVKYECFGSPFWSK